VGERFPHSPFRSPIPAEIVAYDGRQGDSSIRRETMGNEICPETVAFSGLMRQAETAKNGGMAEGMGFEPTIRD
jgi:hypothetical protein